jgi:iron complex transport system permease protein
MQRTEKQRTPRWLTIRLQRPAFSFRFKARLILIMLVLLLLIILAMAVNISVGEFHIPLDAVFGTFFGEGTRAQIFAVMKLRLPRSLLAFLVGAALATSGTILQGLTRNPLASPDIIGISSGASVGAVSVIILWSSAPLWAVPLAALVGACAITLLVYLFAWRGGSSPTRLILVGIGLSAVSAALVQVVMTQNQVFQVTQAQVWLVGSVYGRGWEYFWPLFPWVAFFLPLTLLLARHLDALHLGDDLARGLGSAVEVQRLLLLISSVALASGAVATAGAIGFVGLMAPHMARVLIGPVHSSLLPVAALLGGLLVVAADLVGRTILPPLEIPAGVVTAAIGAPYFIWLLVRSRQL